MADKSLLVLMQEVRGKTLRLIDGVSEMRARWAPAGLENTILWHAGHCYVVVEWIAMGALGGVPLLPDGWFEMFSWESRPAAVPLARWPRQTEVAGELRRQCARLERVLGALSSEQLDSAAPNQRSRTVREATLHALHDEACHSGEKWLLRRLQPSARVLAEE